MHIVTWSRAGAFPGERWERPPARPSRAPILWPKLSSPKRLGKASPGPPLLQTFWIPKPGRWHSGSTFVFCPGDCLFKSKPSPTYAHACGEVTGCIAGCQESVGVAPEVDLGGMYITFASAKKQIRQNPLWLWNPNEEVTRNSKQGYQWPPKKDMCLSKTSWIPKLVSGPSEIRNRWPRVVTNVWPFRKCLQIATRKFPGHLNFQGWHPSAKKYVMLWSVIPAQHVSH